MSKDNMSDREGKAALLGWPERTTALWPPSEDQGCWIRASPKKAIATLPSLRLPGATKFRTCPDGMWVFFAKSGEYADVVAIEVCKSRQNMYDKRSRYMPAIGSLLLDVPLEWLLESVTVQAGAKKPRWEACGSFDVPPSDSETRPVRFMRVLYSVPDWLYPEWRVSHVSPGHEYFCPHSMVSQYTQPPVQAFLKQMTMRSHFYG